MRTGSLKSIGELLVESARAWNNDNASKLAASLAFYTLFSVVPALVVIIEIAGFVVGPRTSQADLIESIREIAGAPQAGTIQAVLHSLGQVAARGATVTGIVTLLLSTTIVFVDLEGSLNLIWKVRPDKTFGVWPVVRKRILSFLVVLSIGAFMAATMAFSTAFNAAVRLVGRPPALLYSLWPYVGFLLSFAATTLFFALIFKFLPHATIHWNDVWLGAAVTSLLFTPAKAVITFYLARSVIGASFGRAGSVVVLLLWVYFSAQIFYYGAEFTHIYAEKHGRGIGPWGRSRNVVPVVKNPIRKTNPPAGELDRSASRR